MTPADDDKTALTPRDLPRGGFEPTNFAPTAPVERTAIIPPPGAKPPDLGNGLPVGTRIGEFEITSVIGEGGFGIVYLANDVSLGRRVALKEYMPSSLAMRTADSGVQVKSERYLETFEAGRKSFVNEARLLAQFDHPSLVKVYRFWESNGTAYMVMPFYEGKNLKDTLREMVAASGEPPGEPWLRTLLLPLTEALRVIHAEQCYHRDIAPDNVMMLAGSQRPLLLDFGAARRVIGDMTQALTVILKPGYAPIEQYAEIPGMRQGPWTDVYALAAVVYFAITGKTPPVSVGRMLNDSYQPLAQVAAGRYSPQFLEAVDRALVVRPEQRTQSIDALREDLGLLEAGPTAAGVTALRVGPVDATRIMPSTTARTARGTGLTEMLGPAAAAPQGFVPPPQAPPPMHAGTPMGTQMGAGTRMAPPAVAAPDDRTRMAPRPPAVAAAPRPAVAAPARPAARAPAADEGGAGRRGLIIGGSAAAVAALAVGGYFALRKPTTAPAPAPTAGPVPAPTPAPTTSGPAVAPVPAPPPPLPPPAAPSFDAVREFDKAVQAQAAGFGLAATAPKTRLRIGADQFRFSVQSGRGGHLYVLGVGPDGTLAQIVPNKRSGAVRLRAGQTWQFPARDNFALDAVEPPGTSHFLVMVATEPRSFEALRPQAEGEITIFAGGQSAAAAVAAHAGAGSVVTGRANCTGAACDPGYGAAVLKFDVVR